ncbi:MAG: hypothetical protein STHCBS139747_003741 [Sporothrix thermara]
MASSEPTKATSISISLAESRYRWIYGTERPDSYVSGGFHPVCIGDVLKQRYRIVDKLGYGGYSTVWLAYDGAAGEYVALKIGIAAPRKRGMDVVASEVQAIKELQGGGADAGIGAAGDAQKGRSSNSLQHPGRRLLPTVLDTFQLVGPNGTHTCYTTAPARDNLRSAVENRLFPLPVARALAGGLAQAVAYLHSRGYVHGDLHLQNVLVAMPPDAADLRLSVDEFYAAHDPPAMASLERCDGQPLTPGVGDDAGAPPHIVYPFTGWALHAKDYSLADARITLADFGASFRPDIMDTVTGKGKIRRGRDCCTPQPMRPLEARFAPDAPLSYAADVWTLALALWDLVAMKPVVSADWASADEVVAQYIDVFGPLPAAWHASPQWREQQALYYDDRGVRRDADQVVIWPSLETAFDEGVQKWRRRRRRRQDQEEEEEHAGVFAEDERAAFLDLMRRMVVYEPEQRLTMSGVLQSAWMQQWALPAWAEAEAVQGRDR